ncbi:MAG TPA: SurA N-terminal domain-containing protein, partial [Bryobacteraceae bacterium]
MRSLVCGRALASCALFSVFLACEKPTPKDVAASVNGRAVTFATLDRAMATQFPNASGKVTSDQTTQLRLEALRALIDDEIMLQRAEKEGLLASDAEVDARFNEIKAP